MKYLNVLIAVVAVLPIQLHAQQTWHVYPGQSIQAAIDDAVPGDDVVVHSEIFRGYTYYESISLESGVTVHSVSYEPEVTIHGGDSITTVFFSGNGQGMYFGGPGVGFIIDGGTQQGIWLNGVADDRCRNIELIDIHVQSDASYAGVRCSWCSETVRFQDLIVHGQTLAFSGAVDLERSNISIEDSQIYDVTGYGIRAGYCLPLTLNSVDIWNCTTGFYSHVCDVYYQGGHIHHCTDNGIYGDSENSPQLVVHLHDVTIDNCVVAVKTQGVGQMPLMGVYATDCTFRSCEDGLSLCQTYSRVKGCLLEDINGIGINSFAGIWPPFMPRKTEIGGPGEGEKNSFHNINGIGVRLDYGSWGTVQSDFNDISGTAISCYSLTYGGVTIENCSFSLCNDGLWLGRFRGSVTGCVFEDIYDTALELRQCHGVINIGGAGQGNRFELVDGIGIHLAPEAEATVEDNEFHHVLGTAIQCETGTGGTSIRDCIVDGSGGCFEGIRTRGTNTMATVRDCIIRDYDSAVIPLPRGVSVTDLFMTGPTADLGTLTDRGYNEFYDNTTDLFYGPMITQPGQTPVSMYAQHNFWGEDPPASQSFGGPWADYIVYIPYSPPPPSPAPPLVDDPSIPADLVLDAVRPNPVRGNAVVAYGLPSEAEAELCIWDIQGRLVRTLLAGGQPAGHGVVEWNTTNDLGNAVPAGVYFCRLASSEGAITHRLVLTR